MPCCSRGSRRSAEPQRCARRQASTAGPLLLGRDRPDMINQSVTSVSHFPLLSVPGFSAIRSQQNFAPRSAPLTSSPCAVFPTDLCCSLHLAILRVLCPVHVHERCPIPVPFRRSLPWWCCAPAAQEAFGLACSEGQAELPEEAPRDPSCISWVVSQCAE